MIKSMFSGVSGLRAHQAKMDVIGNNIANVNTFGYKAGRATFKESIYQTMSGSSDGTDTFGGKNPSQVGYGSQIGSVDLMFSSGSYAPTDSPTDCMIDGNGFFLVGTKDLAGINTGQENPADSDVNALTLTRVGDFRFDGDGYLVDSNSNIVFGFVPVEGGTIEAETELNPIRIPAGETEATRKNINSIRIDDKGNVIGIDADTNEPITIAKIAIANVPNPNALEKSQGPYYKIVSNTGDAVAFGAGDGGTGLMISNGLEMANVDLAKEFSEMITTQRGFQANTRIVTVSDEMLQELISMKR
ncbi:flagellar hook-basal body complex protein [Proteocatella sphenisci]|uniref:flagellar hook-basal body complex protein n=1 Tax=Proteocatella sphenisci TaxID=181070 RepID=UPI00048D8A1E|nr:flagellar hook-basal body complex protein [Proteocatella sphenisci]